jgi:hypothetical protein
MTILEHHRALAHTLDHVQQVASGLLVAGHGSLEHALGLACELCKKFSEHVDLEVDILVPALRESDAWGNLRAQELTEKLGAQRRELSALAIPDECLEPCVLAERLVALVEELRAEIDYEQQRLLTPELLRDDVYGIDVEDG